MHTPFPDIRAVFDLLTDRTVVQRFDVIVYERTAATYQLKVRIELTDGSVLFTNDYVSAQKRKYAFQWQRADHNWLMRWDNAPHFRNMTTFPHHRHDYRTPVERVTESHDITLTEVLEYIRRQLHPISKP